MTFRFETLLRLRKNFEQIEQKKMAQMQQHLYARQNELQDIESSGKHHREELQSRLTQTLDARTLGLYAPYLESLSSRTGQYQQVIAESEQQVETQREQLIESMKKRRALEILKERELLRKRRLAAKKETAFADEMAATRWQRRMP